MKLLILLLLAPLQGALSQRISSPTAVEIRSHERWLEGREQPRFTPFDSSTRWLFVDSARAEGSSRRWFVSIGRGAKEQASVLVRDGIVSAITAAGPRAARALPPGLDSMELMRFQLFKNGLGALALPATAVWDLVPSFHPLRLASGMQWTDTIALETEALGNKQELNGRRVSTLVADTTVDGRRLWIVADSARVRYDELALRKERTLDTLAATQRLATGIVRGRMLYDPALGLFRDRIDTTLLIGSAELRYPDGRAFRVPARYERTRHWILYDSSSYQERARQLQAERERSYSGGVVIVATNPIDERLSKGDTLLRDSLFHVWRTSDDPDLRARLYGQLSLWSRRDTAFVLRLRDMRMADGDSAAWLEALAAREYTQRARSPAIDSATMRRLIAIMADPGYPFAFGVQRDIFYEDLVQSLLASPPAVTSDTSKWPCAPDACRLLAAQWHDATEPRLRKVGLVAAFVLDPHRWADTLVAFPGGARSSLLATATLLARGVGSTFPASSKAPIPLPDANWHAWVAWMTGVDSAFARWTRSALPPRLQRAQPLLGFDGSHRVALRFTELRTGRNISAELRDAWTHATTDSARVVYEYLLYSLGDYRPPPDSIAAHFRSSAVVRHGLARIELESMLTDSTPLADSATVVRLDDDLIAMTLADGRPWRTLDASPDARPALPSREFDVETTYLLADSVPPAVRAKWAGRVRMTTAAEWKARSERAAGTLFTLMPVRRAGPFVRLGLESAGRASRRDDQAPWLYYASTTYYLMQLDGQWVIVGAGGWIT
jgi:hypothetical protein